MNHWCRIWSCVACFGNQWHVFSTQHLLAGMVMKSWSPCHNVEAMKRQTLACNMHCLAAVVCKDSVRWEDCARIICISTHTHIYIYYRYPMVPVGSSMCIQISLCLYMHIHTRICTCIDSMAQHFELVAVCRNSWLLSLRSTCARTSGLPTAGTSLGEAARSRAPTRKLIAIPMSTILQDCCVCVCVCVCVNHLNRCKTSKRRLPFF